MMTLRGWAALALATLSLFLAACSGGSDDGAATPPAPLEPRSGGIAVVGSITAPENLNPYLGMSTIESGVQRRLFPALAYRDPSRPDGHRPGLAESWSFSEDRLTCTFKLADARWSDGKPITASDVRFTWQTQISAELRWPSAGSKELIRDVEVVDPRTVVFHYEKQSPYQLEDTVDGMILPEHVFGAVPLAEWREHDWNNPPVSGGPYLLEEFRAADSVRLVRNPDYFGPPAYLDEILLRIVPLQSNLIAQLRAGEMHYADGISARSAQPLYRDDRLQVVEFDSAGFEFIAWNNRRAPMNDRRFRQAMTMAINREALVEEILFDKGSVTGGPFRQGTWEQDSDLEPWPYDPDQAGRLLDELGWTRPADGGTRRKDGKPLTLEILVQSGNERREAVLIAAQAQLARVGIEIGITSLEFGTIRSRVGQGDYDGLIQSWTFTTGKVDIEALFASHRPGEMNIVGYDSQVMNDLLDRAYGSETREQAKPLLDEIQQLLHRDQPYSFLYRVGRIGVVQERIHDVAGFDAADPLGPLDRAWLE
ncbi:hypothetical protein ABI59_04635 [Acidobacteria bacterium Mor1]|nr:hypothetical protein ABI59_04635 [Acidobacteria bacterium Mor1]